MGILIGSVDYAGMERAVICDTVTERCLALPLFSSEDDALQFLAFVREMDVGDPRALGADSLDRLHTAWIAAREELRVREREEASP